MPMSSHKRSAVTLCVVVVAALSVLVMTPAAHASPAPLPCGDPMVMVFDTTLDPATTDRVGFVLNGGSGDVTVDWGGTGSASPVGTGAATDQVQVYPASPGLVQYTYASSGAYTVRVCASAEAFASPSTAGGVAFSTLTAVSAFGSLGVTDYSNAFLGAAHLTSVPATLPAGVATTQGMFKDAVRFDGDVTGWNTSGVTTMRDMFTGATAFDQNLGPWNVATVSDLSGMFTGVTLSTANYDGLLVGWAGQQVRSGVRFDAGSSTYSSAGAAARTTLTDARGWSVTDGGPSADETITGAIPTITGTPRVDQTLTANPGTWTPSGAALAYQWYRSGAVIGGATSPRLTLGTADLGATLSVTVTGSLPGYPTVSKTSAATAVVGSGDGGSFVSIAPTRILDTRKGTGTPGPVAAHGTIHVQVAGRGGVPSGGVAAVVLNVTETGAARGGYVTVYPDGTPLPVTSTVNFPPGDTRANLVVVRLGSNGRVAATNTSGGSVHLVADVAGYYLAGTASRPRRVRGAEPRRVLDTRKGLGAAGPVAANGLIHVQVTGQGGVPATGVSAVVLNLTETAATASGYLTVYPDGTTLPATSNLNYPAGDTRANLVTVKVGSNGKIAVKSHSRGTVQVVGDIAGYYLSGAGTTAGAFAALTPARLLDTRSATGASGPVAPNGTVRVQVAGRGGVPATGVSAVALNLTITDNRRGGYVTAYPNGTCEPNASSLNVPGGDTRANLVVVQLGVDGKVAFTSHNSGSVQLVADVAGYFGRNTVPAVNPSFQSLAQTAIGAKYAELATHLGSASGSVVLDGCTAHQGYSQGTIVYTNFTDAHGIYGPVYARYIALGGYSKTGPPTADVAALSNYSGGSVGRFTHGVLISSDHGTRWMTPDSASYYFGHGGAGTFGAPITDTTANTVAFTGDSWTKFALRGQTSASSMLYRNSSGGTYWVHGAIYRTWSSLNYAAGPLGRPWSNEFSDGVTMQKFSAGRDHARDQRLAGRIRGCLARLLEQHPPCGHGRPGPAHRRGQLLGAGLPERADRSRQDPGPGQRQLARDHLGGGAVHVSLRLPGRPVQPPHDHNELPGFRSPGPPWRHDRARRRRRPGDRFILRGGVGHLPDQADGQPEQLVGRRLQDDGRRQHLRVQLPQGQRQPLRLVAAFLRARNRHQRLREPLRGVRRLVSLQELVRHAPGRRQARRAGQHQHPHRETGRSRLLLGCLVERTRLPALPEVAMRRAGAFMDGTTGAVTGLSRPVWPLWGCSAG